jgi:hypothetical protein
MNKTVWERHLTRQVEIINAAGGLQIIPYSMFARIEWTGTDWPDKGSFEFGEQGTFPPDHRYIGLDLTGSREEAQLFASSYIATRKEEGWQVDNGQSFDEWKTSPSK